MASQEGELVKSETNSCFLSTPVISSSLPYWVVHGSRVRRGRRERELAIEGGEDKSLFVCLVAGADLC
jgi:hypothetical protein